MLHDHGRRPGVRALAEEWKNQGEYLRSHILQVLALGRRRGLRRTAAPENSPDVGNRRSRRTSAKRISFRPTITASASRSAIRRVRGSKIRRSFSGCSKSNRADIGVRLTEGYMMDPESSVSALIFHNPEAKYFTLSPADIEALDRKLNAAPAAVAAS